MGKDASDLRQGCIGATGLFYTRPSSACRSLSLHTTLIRAVCPSVRSRELRSQRGVADTCCAQPHLKATTQVRANRGPPSDRITTSSAHDAPRANEAWITLECYTCIVADYQRTLEGVSAGGAPSPAYKPPEYLILVNIGYRIDECQIQIAAAAPLHPYLYICRNCYLLCS